jgi:UDP:flavonoid glycosyltransferase YjiC (YdhE family)
LRVFLGAFGDAGHAFPMLALGSALVARGHEVHFETWKRWREHAEAAGIHFADAPEYQVFPTPSAKHLKPYAAAVKAARETGEMVAKIAPDVAVADIMTPAASLAAEVAGVPVATLVPHVYPHLAPGFPIYSIGARLPRTRLGARFWARMTARFVEPALELGREQFNDSRRRLGLPPVPWVHTGLSRELTLVGTLPQLEYPREWPAWARVVGALMWEPPGEKVEPPPGDGPVVLVAPSTAQDREHRLLRAALEGLAGEPVRVIATWNGREPDPPIAAPGNAVLVPWLSYSQTMPACDVVVCHGGHGTLVRALANGCPVVVCPAAGDMAENASRVDWAGLGVRLPRRWATPRGVRAAVGRALRERRLRERAASVARWVAANDGASRAAAELEAWADARSDAPRRPQPGLLDDAGR